MPGVEGAPTSGPTGRLFGSLRRLLVTALTMGRTRLELLSVELQIEAQRALELVIWALVAIFAAGVGLLLAALTVVIVFWDDHRVLAAVMVTGAFLLLAAVAAAIVGHKLRTRPPPLEGTLAELARDRERLGDGAGP